MRLRSRAELASASADMEVDNPVTDARPAAALLSGGSSSGGDDEMKAAAAALVAQLTASGDPKAILEAMAALPQVSTAPSPLHQDFKPYYRHSPTSSPTMSFGGRDLPATGQECIRNCEAHSRIDVSESKSMHRVAHLQFLKAVRNVCHIKTSVLKALASMPTPSSW